MKKNDCIFCKIIAGEIPSHTIYEDENCKVILDINAATKGHALIIVKEHYDNFFELPEEKAVEVIKVAKMLSKQMAENLQCDGFNILQNNNEVAGQTIMHYHMHLIPRYKCDNQDLTMKTMQLSQEELLEIKNIIIG